MPPELAARPTFHVSDDTMAERTRVCFSYILILVRAAAADSAEPPSPGVEKEAVYTADYFHDTNQGRGVYLDNVDLTVGHESGRNAWFAHILYSNASTFSDRVVGDLQTVSNIDNDHHLGIQQLWWARDAGDHSLKIGLYDLNSEFDVLPPASIFINSSHGIGPDFSQSGENGPAIFPFTALAIRFHRRVSAQFSFQVALLDGEPGDPARGFDETVRLSRSEGALLALEANHESERGRIGGGIWLYTRRSQRLQPGEPARNRGVYALAEYRLPFVRAEAHAFARLGAADGRVNPVRAYLGGGVAVSSFIRGRPEAEFGIAIAHARTSDAYRRSVAAAEAAETSIEITLRVPLTDRVTIQPDIQYVLNPGADSRLDNTWVLGIRLECAFGSVDR